MISILNRGDLMKRYVLIVLIFIILILMVIFIPNSNNTLFIKNSNLYINEILPSNMKTGMDDDNDYSDYIELYNGTGYDINLEGYHLSDKVYKTNKWTFPEVVIKKNSYLVIYASGKDRCIDGVCHTNFKLSSRGETVTLTDDMGNILSKVTYGKVGNDISYGYMLGKYYYFTKPTPGMENGNEIVKDLKLSDYKIYINEYMTKNKGSHCISNGGCYDYVELYNYGDKDINVSGLSITDNSKKLNKDTLGSMVIKAHNYLVIYFTGGEKVEGYLCVNFKLSTNDDKIILSYDGKIIDSVDIVELVDNVSYGRIDDKWYYFPTGTPGLENTTKGFQSLGGINGSS